MPADPRDERYLRYFNIANPEILANSRVMVLGVGAVGRQVAIQLAAMGVGHIDIVDFDKVEPANMGSQGYLPTDVGQYKVDALGNTLKGINPDIKIRKSKEKFEFVPLGMNLLDACFCCVDNMRARKALTSPNMAPESPEGPPPPVVVDIRMSPTVIQAFVIDDGNRGVYAKTLFEDSEAFQEPCGSQATIFSSTLAASLAVTQWVQALQGRAPLPFAQLNLDAWVLGPVSMTDGTPSPRPAFSRQRDTSQSAPGTGS